MTDTHEPRPGPTPTPAPGVAVPDKPALEGLEAKWSRGWQEQRHLRLRPDQEPRGGLLDRHPAADRLRLAARRPRLLLHPHRPRRALPADARQGGLLPDGVGRQRPADRAPGAELLRRPLRPVAALRPRLHPAGEAGPEAAGAGQPAELHRAVRAARRRRTRRSSSRCGARSGSRSTGSRPTRRSGRRRRPSRQRAFLRNFARGEAYLQEAPTLWDVTFQTAVAQAELEAREYPGALPPGRLPPARRRARCHIETTRPELIPAVRRADRPPRRRALPAAVRHDGHLAGLRRGDPGPRPPGGRARQGRRHRDVLHVRRPHRRARGGASSQLPVRTVIGRDGRLHRETPEWLTAEPAAAAYARARRQDRPSAPARRWSRCCASPATSRASRRPTQRMANFYEKGDKPLEIVSTRQWYITNGGRDDGAARRARRPRRRDRPGARRTCGTATTTGSTGSTATG